MLATRVPQMVGGDTLLVHRRRLSAEGIIYGGLQRNVVTFRSFADLEHMRDVRVCDVHKGIYVYMGMVATLHARA